MKNKANVKDTGKLIALFFTLMVFVLGASYYVESVFQPGLVVRLILMALRLVFPILGFIYIRKKKITPSVRIGIFLGILLFGGIIQDVKPNPSDALQQVFSIIVYHIDGHGMPGLFAALILCFLANKIACGWACQLGALQDLIFRLNRNKKDTKGIITQYKVPFAISNTVRIIFFLAVTVGFLAFTTDIFTPVDPFNIFNPTTLSVSALIIVAAVAIAALFVYRPWCYFFCPFGLVTWIIEKFSLNKIRVNHDTCTSCQLCHKACPSHTMEAILNQKKTVPDCFMCGTCIQACPNGSIFFGRKKDLPSQIKDNKQVNISK